MQKVRFIARYFTPYRGGGVVVREAQVNFFKKIGYDVQVITTNEGGENLVEDNIHRIAYKHNLKLDLVLEYLGIKEDYLDSWGKNVTKYLLPLIGNNDIVFGTTGGELQSLKIISKLKEVKSFMGVVNYHDPINHTLINGQRVSKIPHFPRDHMEKRYLKNVDGVITSSKTMYNVLLKKYGFLGGKIINNYFGYIKGIENSRISSKVKKNKKITVVYGGAFGYLQSPGKILEAASLLSDELQEKFEFVFMGNYKADKRVVKFINKKNKFGLSVYDYMKNEDYVKFLSSKATVGLVSLASDYIGACVPSKIYDYINVGLPILGVLPDGDAFDLIERNHYGISTSYKNIKDIARGLEILSSKHNILLQYKENIEKNREKWSMSSKFSEIDGFLKNLNKS